MARYRNDDPNDLIAQINGLRDRISKLERVPRLQNTGLDHGIVYITGGGFLFSPDGNFDRGVASIATNHTVDGIESLSFRFLRSQNVTGGNTFFGTGETVDGNVAFQIVGEEGAGPNFFSTWWLFDKSGTPLISDSKNARRGFDHPYLPVTWSAPTFATTTSGTDASFAEGEWYAYHPHIRFRVWIQNDASTASTVSIYDSYNGGIIKTYLSSLGENALVDIVVPRSSFLGLEANGNVLGFSVQHKRSSGAGTCRTRVMSIVAIDLSWSLPW